MGAKSRTEIREFYAKLHAERQQTQTQNFCDFLDFLFAERELAGCTFFTSLHSLCIVRYPTYKLWHNKPLLSLGIASSNHVRIQLRVTRSAKPAYRSTTESSNSPYNIALEEFDRLYELFLQAHAEL